MKHLIPSILSASLLLVWAPAQAEVSPSSGNVAPETVNSAAVSASLKENAKKSETVVFKTHLHCKNCVKKVVENLSYVKGVLDLDVSLEQQTIKITFNPSKTDVGTLAEEIRKLGYPAEKQ